MAGGKGPNIRPKRLCWQAPEQLTEQQASGWRRVSDAVAARLRKTALQARKPQEFALCLQATLQVRGL